MRRWKIGILASVLSLVSVVAPPSLAHASSVRATNGRIVFERYRRRSAPLFAADPDGRHVVRIVHQDGVVFYTPAWSPDGKQLVFGRDRGRRSALVVSSANGTDRHTIYSFRSKPHASPFAARQILEPDWSPDGTTIAFSIGNVNGRGETYSVHPDGTGLTPLTTDVPGPQFDPTWSPNGAHIALEAPKFHRHQFARARIGILTVATHHMRRGPIGASPDWSVDGRIYFEIGGRLYRTHPDGSGATKLPARRAYDPATSPNGKAVAYAGRDHDIRVLHLSTGTTTLVTHTKAPEFGPAWQPVP